MELTIEHIRFACHGADTTYDRQIQADLKRGWVMDYTPYFLDTYTESLKDRVINIWAENVEVTPGHVDSRVLDRWYLNCWEHVTSLIMSPEFPLNKNPPAQWKPELSEVLKDYETNKRLRHSTIHQATAALMVCLDATDADTYNSYLLAFDMWCDWEKCRCVAAQKFDAAITNLKHRLEVEARDRKVYVTPAEILPLQRLAQI